MLQWSFGEAMLAQNRCGRNHQSGTACAAHPALLPAIRVEPIKALLAQRHATTAQNGIGRCEVEEEIRQRVLEQKRMPLECQQLSVRLGVHGRLAAGLADRRRRLGWRRLLVHTLQGRVQAGPAGCAARPDIGAGLNGRRFIQIAGAHHPELRAGR